MLSQKQLDEIKKSLNEAQNPLFFFDNDVDGLSSFLILRRYINRGKGVVIKSYPELNATYLRKINEINPDIIFILDKPVISEDFLEGAKQLGIRIIWIDHHQVQVTQKVLDMLEYYNPLLGKPSTSEPVSYWTYKSTQKKEDEWISILGCLADHYVPDFAVDFASQYEDIFFYGDPEKVLFESELGKLVKVISFALKDRTSFVFKMIKYLFQVKSPYEILKRESKDAEFIYSRFERINKRYVKIIDRAKKSGRKQGKILFFSYRGDLSISADISNELHYLFPSKFIVVAYVKESKTNISLRSSNYMRDKDIDLRELKDKLLEGTDGTYGGHKYACGASIPTEDLVKFKKNLFSLGI